MTIETESARLREKLSATGMVEPVSHSAKSVRNFWVLCRIVPGMEREWLSAVSRILVDDEKRQEGDDDAFVLIARRYLSKGGKVVFGWHVGVSAKSLKVLEEVVSGIVQHLSNKPAKAAAPPTVAPARNRVPAPGQHPPPRAPVPRPPNDGTPRPNISRDTSVRVVSRTVAQDGSTTIIEEMPIPHVYRDMNVVNQKGRGAKSIG